MRSRELSARALARAKWCALFTAQSMLGCGGVDADSGSDAMLRVSGAQFERGALPRDEGGPEVLGAFLDQTTFTVGFRDKAFDGVLGVGSTAALVALQGDKGYWVVPAGAAHADNPDAPSFSAPLSFSEWVGPGRYRLLIQAVDRQARSGEAETLSLTLEALPTPSGELVFSLAWEGEADLDLRLELPSGIAIDKDNVNSWTASGNPEVDAAAWQRGGVLDWDCNADCRYDGRGREKIVFGSEPPKGRYTAFVDTFSLCGQAVAYWSLVAHWKGELVGSVAGISDPSCALPDARATGTRALDLDVE